MKSITTVLLFQWQDNVCNKDSPGSMCIWHSGSVAASCPERIRWSLQIRLSSVIQRWYYPWLCGFNNGEDDRSLNDMWQLAPPSGDQFLIVSHRPTANWGRGSIWSLFLPCRGLPSILPLSTFYWITSISQPTKVNDKPVTVKTKDIL